MLELINLSKSFGGDDDFKVLNEITFSVQKGEFVCVLGPSGCGKTILLYLIAGFLKPTSGEIVIEGKKVSGPNRDRMMLFQNYVLFPWKTVYENILFALDGSDLEKTEKDKIALKYLDLMGLSSFRDWYPYKLSGGMQQRVALARALVTEPQVLLMDEPFAALDSQYRKFLRKNLEKIWEKTKTTIIFITHSVNEAIFLADKIYLMSTRPAIIKRSYNVAIPRPRDSADPRFTHLSREIEADLSEEFEKVIKNPSMEASLGNILKLSGKRGVL